MYMNVFKCSTFKLWKLRILFTYIFRYMLITLISLLFFIPIRFIVHRQVINEELSSAKIELQESQEELDTVIHNLKFTVNKLFSSPEYKRIVLANTYKELQSSKDETMASQLLQQYSYSLDELSYLFINFRRTSLIIDDYRVFKNWNNFYPGSIEVLGLNGEEFKLEFFDSKSDNKCELFLISTKLNRGSYPTQYTMIKVPGYINGIKEGNLFSLISKKRMDSIYLSTRLKDKGAKIHFKFDKSYISDEDNDLSEVVNSMKNRSINSDQKGEQIYVLSENKEYGFSAVLEIPYSIIAAEIRNIDKLLLLYMSLLILLSLIISVYMSHKEIKSMENMYNLVDSSFYGNTNISKKHDIIDMLLRNSENMKKSLVSIENEISLRKFDLTISGMLNSDVDKKEMTNELLLSNNNYLILIPCQDKDDKNAEKESVINKSELIISSFISNVIIDKFGKHVVVKRNEFADVLIFISFSEFNEENLINLSKIVDFVKYRFSPIKPVYVSSVFNSIDDISKIHWKLRFMSQSQCYSDPIVYMSELDFMIHSKNNYAEINNLEVALVNNYYEKARDIISELFSHTDLSLEAIRETFYNVRSLFFSLCSSYGLSKDELIKIFPKQEFLSSKAYIVESLYVSCEFMCNEIASHRTSYRKRLREDIIDYIQNNISDTDLKASKIGDKYCLSSKYIAQLVKEETGLSLGDYINKTRMEEAGRLLKQLDTSNLSEIAEKVGFSKSNTFYKNFKKYYGVSPSIFRETFGDTPYNKMNDESNNK